MKRTDPPPQILMSHKEVGKSHLLTFEQRFWDRVVKTDSCWWWIGSTNGGGYGQIQYGGKRVRIHRLSYQLHVGPIPKGTVVCHHCDNPRCVRPDHLFLGTSRDNAIDREMKGRRLTPRGPESPCYGKPNLLARGEKHGRHILTEDQVRDIRRLRSTGIAQEVIGKMFGVSRGAIGDIDRRKRWAWLE